MNKTHVKSMGLTTKRVGDMDQLQVLEHLDVVCPILVQCPLFSGLEPAHINEVARHGSLHRFERGESLARQGEPSDAFFIFIEGEVVIHLEQQGEEAVELATIGPPESVGEMGVLLETTRSASVRATSDSVLAMRYSGEQFRRMLSNLPLFANVMCRTLAGRLFQANRQASLPDLPMFEGQVDGSVVRLLPSEFQVRHRVFLCK